MQSLLVRRKILRLYWLAHCGLRVRSVGGICVGGKVETQDFASHEEVSAMCMNDNVLSVVCSHCTGDARFCVSTGWRIVV